MTELYILIGLCVAYMLGRFILGLIMSFTLSPSTLAFNYLVHRLKQEGIDMTIEEIQEVVLESVKSSEVIRQHKGRVAGNAHMQMSLEYFVQEMKKPA